jgi:hypothetical protein
VEPHKNLGFLATQETSTHDKKRGKSGKFSPKLQDSSKEVFKKIVQKQTIFINTENFSILMICCTEGKDQIYETAEYHLAKC